MNPFLASGIILILRWLQFIGSREILGSFPEKARMLSELLEDTTQYSARLNNYVQTENHMSDTSDSKKVM
jgi:hypothetical protein